MKQVTGYYRFYDAGQGMTMFMCYSPTLKTRQATLVPHAEATKNREALLALGYLPLPKKPILVQPARRARSRRAG